MKKCKNCNITYSDNKKFCKECGEPLIGFHQTDSGEVAQKAVLGFSKFLQRNLKNIIGILVLALISFSLYYFIFRPDPIKDANKILKAQCDCQEKFYDELIKANNKFLASFEQNHPKWREQAELMLKEVFQKEANENFSKCSNEVKDKISEMKAKYGNSENSKKFSDVFLNAEKSCITENSAELDLSDKEVMDKINSLITQDQYFEQQPRQKSMSESEIKKIQEQIENAVDPTKVPNFPTNPNEKK